MLKLTKTKVVFAGIVLVYLVAFVVLNRNVNPATGGRPIITSDGLGHYDFLPRLFFEHHLQYTAKDYLFASASENNTYVNRFFCGTAVLQLPFFLVGTAYAWFFGYDVNGFSPPFQYAIGLAAVFYALWGFYLLYLILVRFFNINRSNALWTIVFASLGTNIIFYSLWFGSFSHAFSFFAITAFLYRLGATINKTTALNIFFLGLLLGLIIIIRPVNVVVVLLFPAFFHSSRDMLDCFMKKFRPVLFLIFVIGILCCAFIQCWVWYMQTGHWFIWSYRQEGFYFNNPQWLYGLFGFRRGLFVYCPLLILCVVGLWAGWKDNRWRTAWILVFLLVFSWIILSWWHWSYGDTFGLRPFNDVLAVFMILFALLISVFSSWKKIIFSMAFVFTFFNLVFAWQFKQGITNISTMTRDKFFSLFLKTSPQYANLYGGCNDIPPYAPRGFKTLQKYVTHFDSLPGSVLHVKNQEFICVLDKIYPIEEKHTRHLWIELSYKRKLLKPDGMKNVYFVFNATLSSDSSRTWFPTRVKEYPFEAANTWQTVKIRLWLPDAVDALNNMRTYLWNRDKEEFYLDDYCLEVMVPNR